MTQSGRRPLQEGFLATAKFVTRLGRGSRHLSRAMSVINCSSRPEGPVVTAGTVRTGSDNGCFQSGFDPLSVTFLRVVAIELDRDFLHMRACRRVIEDTDLGFQPRGFGAGIESPFRKGRLLYRFVRAADLDQIKLVEAQFISNLADVEKETQTRLTGESDKHTMKLRRFLRSLNQPFLRLRLTCIDRPVSGHEEGQDTGNSSAYGQSPSGTHS